MEKIDQFTGVRAIGAIWVFVYHFKIPILNAYPQLHGIEKILATGNFGVPLFFILSGVVLGVRYNQIDLKKSGDVYTYLVRRVSKILPTNLLTAVLVIPLIVVTATVKNWFGAEQPSWYSFFGWLKTAFGLHAINSPQAQFSWNQPSYTISAELFAYILFIPILMLSNKVGSLNLIRLSISVTIVYYAEFKLPGSMPYSWILYLILVFSAGVFISNTKITSWYEDWLLQAFQLIVPVLLFYFIFIGNQKFLSLLILLILYSLRSDTGVISRILRTRVLVHLGEISYSVYLCHWMIIGYFYLILEKTSMSSLNFKIYVVLTIIFTLSASHFIWKYFEEPTRIKMVEKLVLKK